jgi:DNA polymerase-3 subunit beta
MEMTNIKAANDAAAPVPSFLVERRALQEAATFLSRAIVERKNVIPILCGILVEAAPEGVRLTATDLDITASIVVPGEGQGAIVIADGRGFADAAKACGDVHVMIECTDARACSVSGGTISKTFETMKPDDFPRHIQPPEDGAAFALPMDQLAGDLARVAPAISTEETRYYLNGIYAHLMERDGTATEFRLAATDGHRCHVMTRPVPAGAESIKGAILPRKFVDVVQKLLKAPKLHGAPAGSDVDMRLSESRVAIRIGSWSIASRTIDGCYPDYARVFPRDPNAVATFAADAVAEAMAAAIRVAGKQKEPPCIRLALRDGEAEASCLIFDADRNLVDSAFAPLPCAFQPRGRKPCDSLYIGFNARYLGELVAAFAGGTIDVALQDGSGPALFTSPEVPGFSAVIMPVRVDPPAAAEAPAAKSPEPAAQPPEPAPESAYCRFSRIYSAAWSNRDREGMARACGEYAVVLEKDNPRCSAREHRQSIAILAARIRESSCERPADAGVHVAAGRRARLRHAAATCETSHDVPYVRRGLADTPFPAGSVRLLAEREAVMRQILAIPGYDPDDPRELLPVKLSNGKKALVRAGELRSGGWITVRRVNKDGEPLKRCGAQVYRDQIAEIVQPRPKPFRALPIASPAAAAEAGDRVAALESENAALRDRLDRLESMLESLLAENSAPRPDSAPSSDETGAEAHDQPPPAAPVPAQPQPAGVLGEIIADLAARVDEAEARAARADIERAEAVERASGYADEVAASIDRQQAAISRASDLAARVAELEAEAARFAPLIAAASALVQPVPVALAA